MKAFVPLTDAILDGLDGTETLVPYRPGLPLAGPRDPAVRPGLETAQSRCSSRGSPGRTPSSAALPALSSST